jgi:high-affinity Fe2+/Pb2+ permease
VSERASGKTTGERGFVDVVVYATARLLLAVVLTFVIYVVARLLGVNEFPLVIAALFALIIAMPLGIWLFSPLRRRATAALAIAGERRRREREQLRARLRGETPSEPDSAPDAE